MENVITISTSRYEELLLNEMQLQYVIQILFNEYNTLSYDKSKICFSVDNEQVKLIFPSEYNLHLIGKQNEDK